ncbi:aggregation-promoting factor [Bombilactobacillus bombi]|uniref:Peptidase M23 n=1 Tax=Bombilactobacillus bombi TaxID=1303590 RepID=A0A417ZK49_9LACO|nr:peptidase M23 [Bombilactobacillus bombi]RHW52297.1 peptidase M23 [Bombilactobacillus bombi]
MKFRQVAFATAIGMASFFGVSNVAKADSIYTVKPGDTLSGISMQLKNDLSLVNQVAADNNIQNINMIYVGQKLLIKDDGQVSVATDNEVQSTPAAGSVQQAVTNNSYQAQPTQSVQNDYYNYSNANTGYSSAREWIASRESGGSYSAQNGRYYGKYQLDVSYLGGDYSPANQERVANNYVASRYGSWEGAQQFWMTHGWY